MLLPIFISLLFSIGESSVQNKEESLRPVSFSKNLTAIQSEEGLLLLRKNCYACHNPNTNSHDEIIAPPMQGIKEHYLKAYPTREAFSEAMESFLGNPMAEKALMKGPVKRFGLMPKPAVAKEDLQKIIAYIQDNKLETPAWWADHTMGGHE